MVEMVMEGLRVGKGTVMRKSFPLHRMVFIVVFVREIINNNGQRSRSKARTTRSSVNNKNLQSQDDNGKQFFRRIQIIQNVIRGPVVT